MPKALITGVTGQDGAYLTELLLAKGYEVHGIKRRSSSFNTGRIDHLYADPRSGHARLFLHFGDVTDSTNIIRVVQEVQPDEIYNLAAQSHVGVSFEAIRILGMQKRTRFYQASTSELYGNALKLGGMLDENTPFRPRSPYGVAKLYAYWIAVNYREAYGMYACNGILFNHESERRGETFVSRKITRAVARISLGIEDLLYLGNLDARRDWGHAKDYVEGMWQILQHPEPDDFVLATGISHTVREFAVAAFAEVGVEIVWEGKGVDEVGIDTAKGKPVIRIDPRLFRPTEVDALLGDATKARTKLGWVAKVKFPDLVKGMVAWDLEQAIRLVDSQRS